MALSRVGAGVLGAVVWGAGGAPWRIVCGGDV